MDVVQSISKTSKQAQLQQLAHTDGYGCRLVEQRYCVAMGTHFQMEIGQYFDLVLKNGVVIPCILGDVKNPDHCDKSNIFSNTNQNLCASEFIVDIEKLNTEAKKRGDISFISYQWNSPVKEVIVYQKF